MGGLIVVHLNPSNRSWRFCNLTVNFKLHCILYNKPSGPPPGLDLQTNAKLMKPLLSLLIAGALFAQQDRTAEWKASAIDLDRRLSALTDATSVSAEAWKADSGHFQASLAQFAEGHPELSFNLPASQE